MEAKQWPKRQTDNKREMEEYLVTLDVLVRNQLLSEKLYTYRKGLYDVPAPDGLGSNYFLSQLGRAFVAACQPPKKRVSPKRRTQSRT